MIKDQIYSCLQKYLEKYLIGFDKSQMEVALLSGSIELKGVNLHPGAINKIFEKYQLPFALKAGTIGKFELKVHSALTLSVLRCPG